MILGWVLTSLKNREFLFKFIEVIILDKLLIKKLFKFRGTNCFHSWFLILYQHGFLALEVLEKLLELNPHHFPHYFSYFGFKRTCVNYDFCKEWKEIKKIKPESNNHKIKYIVCWSNYFIPFQRNDWVKFYSLNSDHSNIDFVLRSERMGLGHFLTFLFKLL